MVDIAAGATPSQAGRELSRVGYSGRSVGAVSNKLFMHRDAAKFSSARQRPEE